MVILTGLLIGKLLLGAGVGTAIVGAILYWDQVKEWLYDLVQKIEKIWKQIRNYIPHGAVVLGDKLVDGMIQIAHKLYYQEKGEWIEETTKRKVNAKEVPSRILKKIENNKGQADITENLEDELNLEIS
ncbi:MAG: hypothetical protein II846_00335 [Acetobacter sp.]|nr:hypothetical protein [Acetobacter sp.]